MPVVAIIKAMKRIVWHARSASWWRRDEGKPRERVVTRRWLVLLCCLQSLLATAAPLTVDQPWPGLALPDQHDRATRLTGETWSVVIFTAERQPGDWAQRVVEASFQADARAGRLVLVFDIGRMPALVTTLFALPGLRARPFPVLLARAEEETSFLPREAGAVTVLTLADGRVGTVDFVRSEVELERFLASLSKLKGD